MNTNEYMSNIYGGAGYVEVPCFYITHVYKAPYGENMSLVKLENLRNKSRIFSVF